jgi:hypothetical protein
VSGGIIMKITKTQLKKIIKEELKGSLKEDNGEGMSPEAMALFEEGKAFFTKIITMGKNEHPDAGIIVDALGEWAGEESFGYVKLRSSW